MKPFILLALSLIFCVFSYAQTTLNADGPGNTYELITSVLAPGANPIEAPDCSHTSFGRHITEVWDADLGAYVFAFHIHATIDDDRCINFDRQRNEIKTYSQSPDSLKGVIGETVTYKWKFKLDAAFQASNSFTHIHQLKAVDGPEASMPQITLTCRAGNPDELELRYAEDFTQVTLATADLNLFKGEWVEATETVTFGEPGSYDLSLVKVSDGSTLFSYSDPSIRMWKTNASFIRPKWGIYRSLNNVSQLIDEIVLFNDFYIEEIGGINVPSEGTGEVIITEYFNRPLKPSQTQLNAALPNNPPGADTTPNEGHMEWFEVYNTTGSAVVMDGWTLTDASSSSNVSTISNFTLPAYSYAVFSGFDIPDAQGGISFDYFYDYKKPSFNNESSYEDPGDTSCPDGVIIEKADGTLVDQVKYDYGYGEYIGNAGSSNSCSFNTAAIGLPAMGSPYKVSFMLNVDSAIMNAADNDLAANWSFSSLVYDAAGGQKGTPGAQNDKAVSPCSTDLTLSGLETNSALKEVEFFIISTEQIDNGSSVDYSAGTVIELNPGFEVFLGAQFEAYILGCN